MDDSSMYSGVDAIPDTGLFGNEIVEESVKEQLHEQDRLLKELTPKLQDILSMLDAERDLTLEFIAGYVDNAKDPTATMIAELKAAGRYRKYLQDLKTKFALALGETLK